MIDPPTSQKSSDQDSLPTSICPQSKNSPSNQSLSQENIQESKICLSSQLHPPNLPPLLHKPWNQVLNQLDSLEVHHRFIQLAVQLEQLEEVASLYQQLQHSHPHQQELWDQCKSKLIQATTAQWMILNQTAHQKKQNDLKIWKITLWGFIVLCTSFGVYQLMETIEFLKIGSVPW